MDQQDLQAIAQLLNTTLDQRFEDFKKEVDEKLVAFEKKVDEKLEDQRESIMSGVTTLMDLEFGSRFNVLSESVNGIRTDIKRIWRRMEAIERIPVLEAAVRQHSRQIEELEVRVEDLEKAN